MNVRARYADAVQVTVAAVGSLTLARASRGPDMHFASGLPGFPDSRRFGLRSWDGDGPFSLLVDMDHPDVQFLVTSPAVFFPDYDVDLDDWVVARLGGQAHEDLLVLVIVTVDGHPGSASANLLGPIVVNLSTREAVQTVLSDTRYGTRVPLVSAPQPASRGS